MKRIAVFLVFILLACSRDSLKDVIDGSTNGSVQLSVNLGNFFLGGTGATSPWAHHYQESVDLTFSSTTSVYTKTVSFNPNDLSTFPATSLPYDTYTWSIANTGSDVTVSDVLYVYGSSTSNFVVNTPTATVSLGLDTDFALVTVATDNLSSASIKYNGESTNLTIQDGYYYGYINANNSDYTLNIVSTDAQAGADTINSPVAYTHYNYSVNIQQFGDAGADLFLNQDFVLEDREISTENDDDLDGVPNSLDECPDTPSGIPVSENGCSLPPIYLDENGVTIKAQEWAQIGDSGEINGITYTIVDETTLRLMVSTGQNVTDLCTSLVTDMSRLFQSSTFNQNISSWDVSNVTTMMQMFEDAISFNQDISVWNVSNVTDMTQMFMRTSSSIAPPVFNQDIGSWDVSNVTNMSNMFSRSVFNQDISSWDVGNVIYMQRMFQSNFVFNQPIIGWDVSNVIEMTDMFNSAVNFNQNLSNWSTNNVMQCNNFSSGASSWTLPHPTFINCTP